MSRILRKAVAERSAEEGRLLAESEDLVTELQGRSRRREGLKRRQEEVCDDPEELRRKVRELAGAVRNAKYLVVYTGAGISTAASIPDYRGPNGVWTLLQKGRSIRYSMWCLRTAMGSTCGAGCLGRPSRSSTGTCTLRSVQPAHPTGST